MKEEITCCKVANCSGLGAKTNGKYYFHQGYCMKHYARLKRRGDALIAERVFGEDRLKNPLYRTYSGILARCYSEKDKAYKNYGGRNIKVSDEWLGMTGFPTFLTDMGERPSENHSIDRIDNDKSYCKENCKWSTKHQQSANRRNSSKTVGVILDKKTNKWRSSLSVNGKLIYLGAYDNYEKAVLERKKAEIKYNIYEDKLKTITINS